jgi:hypothetical protein
MAAKDGNGFLIDRVRCVRFVFVATCLLVCNLLRVMLLTNERLVCTSEVCFVVVLVSLTFNYACLLLVNA